MHCGSFAGSLSSKVQLRKVEAQQVAALKSSRSSSRAVRVAALRRLDVQAVSMTPLKSFDCLHPLIQLTF